MENKILSQLKKKMFPSALSVILLCILSGCAGEASDTPELGLVSGTVTMDGKPLADADLVFEPKTGSPSVGKTDVDGNYQLAFNQDSKGAMIGQHTVRITKFGEPGSANDTKNQISEKYGSKSKLTAEVVAGDNTFNFDL